MALQWARQTWTLTQKNLLIVLWRHWFSTPFRALVLPVVFMFFISYAKNFFVPPSIFGTGTAVPILSFQDALHASGAGRNTVVFVNNGFTSGQIDDAINQLSQQVVAAGRTSTRASNETALLSICRSSLNGVTPCYGAVSFHSSPTEGTGSIWNYTLFGDGALGEKIFVNRHDNDQEIYTLPFQHAIDRAITGISGTQIPETVEEYPFTDKTQEQRAKAITKAFQGSVISILAVAFFLGIVGVTYQLVGHMASEREIGMSQLIEAMMPNKRRWETQAARILANHLAFDIIYLPGWIIMGVIVQILVFPASSFGVLIGEHILIGLALTSWSILFASFFSRAQLSGITTTIISIVLAIVAQLAIGVQAPSGTVIGLSLVFPPMNYVFFIMYMAQFQEDLMPANLSTYAHQSYSKVTGITFWGLMIFQIFFFPLLGALVERTLYGTASKDRKFTHPKEPPAISVKLTNFSKHYGSSWFFRNILCCGRRKYRQDKVVAVNDLSLDVLRGQIMILLGANGSGKSTTLDAIAGLNKITHGSIEVDGTGGLGLCPQKNVLWDVVTVEEHITIFNRLKSPSNHASKSDIRSLISACDLDIKTKARSSTLSGGQKRKLQLAMMFTGGSRVCCIDEVSSGIDPLARRKIWDILLAERGRRTILLTTHFLDEADVLSDGIAILSKGNLKAEGSAVELKHKLGRGYRVNLANDRSIPDSGFESFTKIVDYDQTVYHFPDQAAVSQFIAALERGGRYDYTVQGPTIEDVFLKLAEEITGDFGLDGAASPSSLSSNHSSTEPKIRGEKVTETELNLKRINLLPGKETSIFRQGWVLFRKRVTVLRYNYLPYAAAILIPVIAAGLVTLFLASNFAPLGCTPNAANEHFDITAGLISAAGGVDIVFGPPNVVSAQTFSSILPSIPQSDLHQVNTLAQFNSYIDTFYANVTPGGFFAGQTPVLAWQADYDVATAVLTQNGLDSILARELIYTSYSPFAIPFAPSAGKTLQVILYFGLAMCAFPGFFGLYPTAERLRKVRALHYSNGVRSAPLWIAYTFFDFIFVLIVSIVTIALLTSQWDGWYYPGYVFVVFFLYGLTSTAYSYVISLFTTSQLAAFAFSAGSQAVLFLLYFISYLAIITYAPVNLIDQSVNIAHFTIGLITPAGNLLRALLLTFNEFSLICHGDAVASYGGDILVFGGPILYLIVQFFLLLAFLIWWDGGGRIKFFTRTSKGRIQDLEDRDGTRVEMAEAVEELSRVETANDGLRVLHLTKKFGSNLAVDDVTFGIKKGETFALLGPNGAGKSTTISLIRGDLRPSSKTSDIYVEGNAISQNRNAVRNHLGVCPQFDAIDRMTVRQHLVFYGRVRGVSNVEHNVQEVMRAVGLKAYASRIAGNLSGGNKRKLSLAIALIGNPSVLLLDEPSSGMDAAAKRIMWQVLGSLTEGRALLITSHSMEEAQALAQRAGILAQHMLALGTTEELRKKHGDAYYVHLVHKDAPHTSAQEMERVKAWLKANVPGADLEERTYHGQLRFSVQNAPDARRAEEGEEEAQTMPGAQPTMSASTLKKQRLNVDVRVDTQSVQRRTAAAEEGLDSPVSPISEDNEAVADAIEMINSRSNGSIKGAGGSVSTLFRLLEAHKQELGFAYYSVMPTTLDQVFLNVVSRHNVLEENYHQNPSSSRASSGEKDRKRRRFGIF